MLKAKYFKHTLNFKRPSGTSRGVMTTKETWFIIIEDQGKRGVGECGILRGLSIDDRPEYEAKLQWVCNHIQFGLEHLLNELTEYPSIQFGLEMAFKSLESQGEYLLFPSAFTKGFEHIPINGLIWMGSEAFMRQQISEKIDELIYKII